MKDFDQEGKRVLLEAIFGPLLDHPDDEVSYPKRYLHSGLGGPPVDEDGLTPVEYWGPHPRTKPSADDTYGSLSDEVLSSTELTLVAFGLMAALLTPVIIWRKWRRRRSS